MSRVPDTILVSRSPGETRYALLAGDEVIEIVHRRDFAMQAGAIHVGRIGAGVPGVSAVFVELGDTQPGVMHVKGRPPPQGSAVAVSIVVPARAGKGADLKLSDMVVPPDAKVPSVLRAAPSHVLTWWDCYRDGIERIAVSPSREMMAVKALLSADAPVEEGGAGLFAEIDATIEAEVQPHLPLPSGGSLIIEHTAAVTAIDVNSGSSDPGTANSEAVIAVAAALRRRNIAGHIVVDFISSGKRSNLARALADAVSPDLTQTNVAGVTPLGMVELTRKRVGLSLAETVCDAGGGFSTATVAYKLLRDAVHLAFTERAAEVEASCAPEVAAQVQGPLRAALDEARDTIKGDIKLTARADFSRHRVELRRA
jgi:ribonuclease G